ncbi:hypothetical protein FA13DRAFT_1816877 [Coprinellus micaceus]|uniref:DUF6534 domain-containing protein n=1 Tax=Coprinellus micaceus TaxID=71717 RepID=A0A4Y7SX38_COPMI|nr:hypothetical protein FA13DRAFT_1816877 [Coprinellus micaceus]
MVQHEATIFAPLFWGFVLSIFLGGMTVVQAHTYFPAKNDRPFIRVTAALMLLFDIASSILIAYSVYYYLIPEFGSFERFRAVTPQFSAECLISVLITFISQLYFVHQLVVVKRSGSGNWIVIGLIAFFAVVSAVGGIGCVTSMYIWNTGVLASVRNQIFAIFFGVAKGFSAVTDVLATIAMCMFLTDQRGQLDKTRSLVAQISVFVIQRGILVTAIQVAVLIAFFASSTNLAWLALHMNVTRLYANTFFAMLNGRSHLREKSSGVFMSNFNSSSHTRGPSASHHPAESINLDHRLALNRSSLGTEPEAQWALEKNPHIQLPVVTKTVVVSDV